MPQISPAPFTSKRIGTHVPLSSLYSRSEPSQPSFFAGCRFINWLKKTRQAAWAMLPLQQTQLEPGSSSIHVPSPYKSYGIGLDPRYLSLKIPTSNQPDLTAFRRQHRDWVENYCLFCALRDRFGTDAWPSWPVEFRRPTPASLYRWKRQLHASIQNHLLTQWRLHQQYAGLRWLAEKNNILLCCDLPFYLPLASPLVWLYQHLFALEENCRPLLVSGLPDSPKAHFGRQIWGHPLYRWGNSALKGKILRLWKLRLKYLSCLFHVVRLDHAKGLFSYGAIAKKSNQDQMLAGPGAPFLGQLIKFARTQLGIAVYAEDSGDSVAPLRRVLARLQVPGIRIFRYGLTTHKGLDINPIYAHPAFYPPNSVAATTTHDTETLVGYLTSLNPLEQQTLANLNSAAHFSDLETLAQILRSQVIASPARLVLIPLQDWLLISNRINLPGSETPTNDPNWRWRLPMPVEALPRLKPQF